MQPVKKEFLKGSEYISGLVKKLADGVSPKITGSLCCWIDLLGFGKKLYESNWHPSYKQWMKILERIRDAHLQCYTNLDPSFEFVLTLNDGIVRCCDVIKLTHLDCVSMWFRSCIWTHNMINESEKNKGMPGARTIVTYGSKLIHSPTAITFDDFVFNYTKKDPTKPSSLVRKYGDKIVAFNPSELQLNLAFSKAFILDSLGSNAGIIGPHFFIDESVISFLEELPNKFKSDLKALHMDQKGYRLFAIPSRRDNSRYHIGFELAKPCVNVNDKKIKTKLFRLTNFYPWDEDVDDFKNPVY